MEEKANGFDLLIEDAKLGVLAGSLISALAGAAVLRMAPRVNAD